MQNNVYEKYWDSEQIEAGLASKTLCQGKLRINQRNYEDAFMNDPVSHLKFDRKYIQAA